MQIHRKGDTINYYSRSAKDSGEMYNYTIFDAVIKEQVKEDPCIIDCEIVAWNKRECASYNPESSQSALPTHPSPR